MGVAAAALSGLPPLSGFFSKELILGRLAALDNPVWFVAGAGGAFLTAYYTFRLIFIILFPQDAQASEDRHGHGAHDAAGARAMTAVLWILAGVTVLLGFGETPVHHFLEAALGAHSSQAIAHHGWLPVAACLLAGIGILLAWLEFGRRGASRVGFVERLPALADFFGQRWYLDRLYRYLLDTVVYQGIARLFAWNDRRVIDGALDGLAGSTIGLGGFIARLHAGLIQHRLTAMFAVVAALILYFGLSG
jgi:NADH-quinone oxidoreductase subunit L